MLGSECFLLSLVAPRCKKEREEDPIIDKNVGRDGRKWGGGGRRENTGDGGHAASHVTQGLSYELLKSRLRYVREREPTHLLARNSQVMIVLLSRRKKYRYVRSPLRFVL